MGCYNEVLISKSVSGLVDLVMCDKQSNGSRTMVESMKIVSTALINCFTIMESIQVAVSVLILFLVNLNVL